MKIKKLRYLIYTDLYRISGQTTTKTFINSILFNPGFQYSFWMRTCNYLKYQKILKYLFYVFAKGILRHYVFKYGIHIGFTTQIGEGFYIGHFGGIFINRHTQIGKNCNISQDVTIGHKVRGDFRGTPIIGDNVYIAPGSKIFGSIKIGNNVAIGANCVVTKDIPDKAVVVGVPGKVISYKGSEGYVCFTKYKTYKEF